MNIEKLVPMPGWGIFELSTKEYDDIYEAVGPDTFNDFAKVVKVGEPLSPIEEIPFYTGDNVVLIKYSGKRIFDDDKIYIIANLFDVVAYEAGDK